MLDAAIRHLLLPPGPERSYALSRVVSATGDGIYYVCAALYMTRIVGLEPTEFGVGMTIAWTLGFIAAVPIGHLADRLGPRVVAAGADACAALALASYLTIHSFMLFVLAASIYAVCQRGGSAARWPLLVGLVPRSEVTRARAHAQVAFNAGLSLGAAVGGAALWLDTRPAYMAIFALDALSFLIAAGLIMRLPAVPPAGGTSNDDHKRNVFQDRPYVLVSALNAVILLHIPLADIVLPLWVADHTAAPRWVVSGLLIMNTLAVVTMQVRVARGITGLDTACRYVRLAGFLLLASCLVFAGSATGSSPLLATSALVLAGALQVLGEMLHMSSTWEISFALAPADKQGQYQGFFGSGLAVAEMIAPAMLTVAILQRGALGWIGLGCAIAAAAAVMTPAVGWASRRQGVAMRPFLSRSSG